MKLLHFSKRPHQRKVSLNDDTGKKVNASGQEGRALSDNSSINLPSSCAPLALP
uniref:Uncharacterized protein n=1 Tax=Arundo donax TaxID=35708 RepID=A0A0A9CMR6_ARUDO